MNQMEYKLNLNPGMGIPPTVRISQGDIGRHLVFVIYDGASLATIPAGSTAAITGVKRSGLGFTVNCTISGSNISVDTTEGMVQESGNVVTEIRITSGQTNVGTANFNIVIEPAAHPAGTTDGTTAEARTVLARCESYAQEAQEAAAAVPAHVDELVEEKIADEIAVVNQAIALKADQSTTYTKTEVDNLIESVDVETDTTLSVSGKPADAKTVGDAISEINESFGAENDNLIISNSQMAAFSGVFLTVWEQGGLYVSSGLPYNTRSAIRTDFINVANSDKVIISNPKGVTWNLYAYNANKEYVKSASPDYTDDATGEYVVPDTIEYIRIQLSITGETISIIGADGFSITSSHGYIFDYTDSKYADKSRVNLNRTQMATFSGIFFVDWEQGGLYVSSGLPYNTRSAIRTDFISTDGIESFLFKNPNGATWKVYAYDSNKEFVRASTTISGNDDSGIYVVPTSIKYIRVQLSITGTTISLSDAEGFMVANVDGYIFNYANVYRREISILFIGNSLTQDGIAYLPYLLKTYYPEISFKFYMWYNGGYTLAQQYSKFTNNETCTIFSVAENSASWTNYSNAKTMSEILANYTFDVVCLQEYFNGKSSYTDADISVWNNCRNYVQEHYEGGNGLEFISLFHAPKRASAESVFNLTKSGNALILKSTLTQDMIPNGIAVYRALSSDLDSLGDEEHLSPDGIHTQEGLPCLLQTYVTLCWLFDKLAINKSVYGCPMRMTTAIYNTINVPGANLGSGVITGTDAENLLAQEIAIKAYKEGKWFVMNNIYSEN